MKDVFIIRNYKAKDGSERTDWVRAGFSFGTNKDGSLNFELYTMPGVNFNIRDRKKKDEASEDQTSF